MKHARFIAPARREILSEVVYFNGKAGIGFGFAAAVEEATAPAVTFPLAGSPASKKTRRVFVKDFPFAAVCRPDESGIVIFAVAHHARHPEYWQPRVQDCKSVMADS